MRKVVFGVIIGLVVVVCLFVALSAGSWKLIRMHEEGSLLKNAGIGWAAEQVIDHLGQPKYILDSSEDTGWLNDGWYPPPSPIQHKMFVYSKLTCRMYVYINKEGRVSHVLISRT